MLSPRFQYPLEQFEGSPTTLRRTAQRFVDLGAAMDTTADALADVADSDVHRSMGTDALAEQAEDVVEDLRKAAIRYAGTGDALLPYAEALLEARNWYTRNADDLRAAELAYQQALADRDAATMNPDVEAQADAASDAQAAIDAVEGTRDSLWTQYETVVDDWSTAYERAAEAEAVSEAMDEADNDDVRRQVLTDTLALIGWILAVVAVFVVSQPWATIIFAMAMTLSVIHLAGTIFAYANGQASMSDILMSVFGLVTLGAGGLLSRGAPAALGTIDEFAHIARLGPGAPAGVSQLPSLLSPRNAWLALQRGDEVARLAQYGDDLVRLAGEGSSLTRTLGLMIGGDVAALGPNLGAAVQTLVIEAIGVAGNVPGLLPSFGAP